MIFAMSKYRVLPAAIALVGLLAASACEPRPGERAAGAPIVVLATTGIVADVVTRIAGEEAEVVALMPTGVDPHLFKPSEGDVRRLAGADLIFYNGLHLEGKMTDILVRMARQRPVVAVTETLPRELLREPEEFQGQYDPHVWFDVSLWAQTLEVIARELAELDPDHAELYRRRAFELGDELMELDRWVEERLSEVPPERRILVTAHDAFGYFGQRYGFDVVGIQGISTLSEAGLRDVERVVDLVVERRVPAIFYESSIAPRSIEAVQAACRARGHAPAIGGELFSDSMGPPGTPEGTYPGMVRHNIDTIVEALR